MPKLSEILFGTKDKVKQLPTINPLQEELINLIKEGLTSGEGPFGKLFGDFDQEGFDKGVTQPALKNFEENILPMLQEKFIANNQIGGSGFNRAKLKAGTDLQDKLAQLMYQAQQDQQKNKLTGIQDILGTKTFENLYKTRDKGAIEGLIQGAAPGLGQAFGTGIKTMVG